MTSGSGVTAQAFKRLIRATGVNPGNAFLGPRHPISPGEKPGDDDVWCNYSVSTRDTLATCEIETQQYFGPNSPALICVRVRPATPSHAFPTSCIITLSTSSQRMDELAVHDVIVKEWSMSSANSLHPDSMETTIAVRMVYHIACLVGKTPSSDTRIFLTLRFIGCCDTSQTHRIAAVELFYSSLPPLITPSSMTSGDSQAATISCSDSNVEVKLTLSPTLSVCAFSDDRDVEVFSGHTSRPIYDWQNCVERIIKINDEPSPSKGPTPITMRLLPAMNQLHTCQYCNGVCSGSSSNSDTGVHVDDSSVGCVGEKRDTETEDDMKECVLAEYRVQTTPSSPRCRSATLPQKKTIFVDVDINEDLSDNIIELPTSPCTTLSGSSRPNRTHTASELGQGTDVSMSQSLRLTAPLLSRSHRDEGRVAPHREPPPTPPGSIISKDVLLSEYAQQYRHDKPSKEPEFLSPAMDQSVPLLSRAAFVVPDRRDFVPVRALQQRQQCGYRPQNGLGTLWGEHNHFPFSTQSEDDNWTAAVAKSRRHIRNLCDVPMYREQDDLLKTATELLGVDRESLRKRASSSSSSSRLSSIALNTRTSTQSNIPSRLKSPPPQCTESGGKELKKQLTSLERERPTFPVKMPESTVATKNIPSFPEDTGPSAPRTPRDSSSVVTGVLRVSPRRSLMPNEEKKHQPIQDLSRRAILESSSMKNVPLTGSGTKAETVFQPLEDQSSDANFQKDSSKTAFREVRVAWERENRMGSTPFLLNKSLPTSEDSDEPLLVVQVEEPTTIQPQKCWGDSIVLAHPGGTPESFAMSPCIGTFLVWKHHVSRTGTAKRIFCLQRQEDAVLVSLKKLDSSKKMLQVTLREKIEVITGLRAYYSNSIHTSNVHMAECCLVLMCSGEQVAAVEMQSVSELRLAVQLLRPICAAVTM